MRHVLVETPGFLRDVRRMLKLKQKARRGFEAALRQLESCSAGYGLRILFQFKKHQAHPALLLLAVGSHDEVY